MLKLSPCAEMLFTELNFLDRIDAFEKMGFSAFEFWGWRNKDIEGILRKIEKNKMRISSMCIDPMVGIVDSKNKDEFLKSAEETIPVAKKIGISILIVTTGNQLNNISREEQHNNIVACLKAVSPLVEKEKITIVLEPLNILVDHKGYYLSTSAEGFQIIREVASKNIRLLFDIYHQQITEGNLIQNITQNLDLIGHFHSADVPGRYEFGTGELNYRNIIHRIKDSGFNGYIGLEFRPLKSTEEALKSVKKILRGVCE